MSTRSSRFSSAHRIYLGTAILAALLTSGAAGCSDATSPASSTPAGTPAPMATAGGEPLTVGFIYVGPKDDYGYNQAHADGAAAVAKMEGVKTMQEENVKETVDVQKTMEGMIQQDGAKLIFPTSFGYFDPHVLIEAKKHPEITFLHCGGLWKESEHPKNVGSYFGFIDECQYISGIVAGHMSKSKKIGFVAAKPIPQVRRNINAFTLGARSVDPKITCLVIFTGEWSMPNKEADATTSLIDQGVDVITCHVDSPKVVVENAEKRGIYVCGYHCNQAVLAPKGYLTGAEWNWEKVYTDYIKMYQSKQKIPNLLRGGLKDQIVRMSPYGPAVSEAAKKSAEAAKAKFMAGNFAIYKGEMKDNNGKVILAAGKSIEQADPVLEQMDYFVEGVQAR